MRSFCLAPPCIVFFFRSFDGVVLELLFFDVGCPRAFRVFRCYSFVFQQVILPMHSPGSICRTVHSSHVRWPMQSQGSSDLFLSDKYNQGSIGKDRSLWLATQQWGWVEHLNRQVFKLTPSQPVCSPRLTCKANYTKSIVSRKAQEGSKLSSSTGRKFLIKKEQERHS